MLPSSETPAQDGLPSWLRRMLPLVFVLLIAGLLSVSLAVYYRQQATIVQLRAELADEQERKAALEVRLEQLRERGVQTAAASDSTPEAKPAAEAEATNEEQPSQTTEAIGYIKRLYSSEGKTLLEIDYVDMLASEEAQAAAREDGAEFEGDYYIRNRNPRLRTFELNNDAVITLFTYRMAQSGVGAQTIALADFQAIFSGGDPESERLSEAPYWIEVRGDAINSVAEQYLP